MGRAARGVEPASVGELDERGLVAWMEPSAAIPFLGGKKR